MFLLCIAYDGDGASVAAANQLEAFVCYKNDVRPATMGMVCDGESVQKKWPSTVAARRVVQGVCR